MSDCNDVQRAIAKHGLLLLQDKTALDVVSILSGEKLSTSWWSHAAGQKIFACLERLDDDADVLTTRLVAGKITYIHRRLWPAFLAIALSQETWQTNSLSADALRLFDSVKNSSTRASGKPARELQERLLVHAQQVHTESGRHETLLDAWPRVQKVRGTVAAPDVDAARAAIEAVVTRIDGSTASLPWHRFGSTKRSKRTSPTPN